MKRPHAYTRKEPKMKPEVIKKVQKKKDLRVLTLDQIEEKMVELATSPTTDVLEMMMNEKKIAMLEKIANLKMHRLQLKELEQEGKVVEISPIEVKFIDSNNVDTNNRVAEMESKLEKQLGMSVPKS